MGLFSSKKLSLPPLPEYYNDPFFQGGLSDIFSESSRLRNLDFSNNPLMAETIDLDPEVTNLALKYAQNSLNPAFSRNRQNTINDLANLGALESSTTADALARSDFDLNSQLQAIVAQAALGDRERALSNRTSLFGTGLNLLESGTGLGLQNQGMRNQFNMQNYENAVAQDMATKSDKGGGMGALMGGAGGLIAGLALAPATGGMSLMIPALTTAAGATAGYAGPSGTGGQILNAGSMIFGSGLGGGVKPGSTAGAGNLLAKQSNPSITNPFASGTMSGAFNSLYM